MNRIRILTAGESHGQALVGIIEGIPAGLPLTEEEIAMQLQRRQMGHGRGKRMQIESDRAKILSGVRFGKTLGSPIALLIENKDWLNWQNKMAIEETENPAKPVTVPRPGHADLAGVIKYGHKDIRNVLERASARETAMRVALGTIARKFLKQFAIEIVSHVIQIHEANSAYSLVGLSGTENHLPGLNIPLTEISQIADQSPVRCLDKKAEKEMMAKIDQAKEQRDTVGGTFEVAALNVPAGLGSHVHWDRKLDGRIAHVMMSIPAIKGVEIGLGFKASARFGSEVHDPIYYDPEHKFYRSRNHAGGLEGGITNGMPVVVRVAMKPISTLLNPLDSVDLLTKKKTRAHVERSDICAVPAASVIGEAILALVLADAFLEKFGGDSIEEIQKHYETWKRLADI